MGQKTIREISVAWKEYKQPYVKQSTMAAYVLILENHILPNFGESDTLHEQAVQEFVLQKNREWTECEIRKRHFDCTENGYEIRRKK